MRLDELYTALAAQNTLRPTCVREVVPTKAGYDQQVTPVARHIEHTRHVRGQGS